MSHSSIQGAGAPVISAEALDYGRQIAAAMGPDENAPSMGQDHVGSGSQRGPATTSMALHGKPLPELQADTQTGQLFADGKPYLGKQLFLQADNTVLDAQGKQVDLTALEKAAGYDTGDGTTAATGATQPTQPAATGKQTPEIYTESDGRIVTADHKPYLGLELYMKPDQSVVDKAGNPVNLAQLEQQAGYAPPAAPAPPMMYRGTNDQLVGTDGKAYLGVAMFVRGDQVVDANGQSIDLDATIASAGFDPKQTPSDPPATTPPGPIPVVGAQPTAPAATGAMPEAPKGEGRAGGIIRNLIAGGLDYRRWRAAVAPPAVDPTAATTGKRTRKVSDTPPLPKTKAGTTKRPAKTGETQSTRKNGKIEPEVSLPGGRKKVPIGKAITTEPKTTNKTTGKTTGKTSPTTTPEGGVRKVRITPESRKAFQKQLREIQKTSTSKPITLPREARKLTANQRTQLKTALQEHQTASKALVKSEAQVRKWNSRDPEILTTSEFRQMTRDKQLAQLAKERVEATTGKIKTFETKIGKTLIKTTSTKTPINGVREVRITPAARKEFQTQFTQAKSAAATPRLPAGLTGLTKVQKTRLTADLQEHRVAVKQVATTTSALKKWNNQQPETLSTTEFRQMTRDQQVAELAKQRLAKTSGKIKTWEEKTGKSLLKETTTQERTIKPISKTTKQRPLKPLAENTRTRKTAGTTSTKGGIKPSGKAEPAVKTSALSAIGGRIIPGLLLANDAYSLYQGVNHWSDAGNERKYDDVLRIAGASASAIGDAQGFRKGNLGAGIKLSVTGLALNTLGQMLNDQD